MVPPRPVWLDETILARKGECWAHRFAHRKWVFCEQIVDKLFTIAEGSEQLEMSQGSQRKPYMSYTTSEFVEPELDALEWDARRRASMRCSGYPCAHARVGNKSRSASSRVESLSSPESSS